MRFAIATLLSLAAISPTAVAAPWTGQGELGLAAARGNARSENLNAKLDFLNEDDQWKHAFNVSVLRAKGEVTGDFDGDGVTEESYELNANRYTLGASSAMKMNERSSWIAALRHEKDDFASYETQSTFSIGYGYTVFNTDETALTLELGPGFRRAKVAATGETESSMIARGLVDYRLSLTANTDLTNALLIESGSDNTFAQNTFGVAVAMNDKLALKFGLEARYNSESTPGTKSTDTLTTMNLVYSFK